MLTAQCISVEWSILLKDPIRSHPTRGEQLDILATVIADRAVTDDRILDFGCGTGYVAKLILAKRADVSITGIDLKPDSLAEARRNLMPYEDRFDGYAGNLEALNEIDVPDGPYRFAITVLTFHDLPDEVKRGVIDFATDRLTDDGYFLLYDRLRLTEAATFPLQQSIWQRIEREHGRGMRTARSFEDYKADIAPNNRPASLEDYFDWFSSAGLSTQVLHLHGNVALIAGAKQG